jgi:hypothetical protein
MVDPDVLRRVHRTPTRSDRFLDREELSWVENVRNFRLTASVRNLVTVMAISGLFNAEACQLFAMRPARATVRRHADAG